MMEYIRMKLRKKRYNYGTKHYPALSTVYRVDRVVKISAALKDLDLLELENFYNAKA